MQKKQEKRIRHNLKILEKEDLIDLFLEMFKPERAAHSRIKIRNFEIDCNESLSKTKKVMEELLRKYKRIDKPSLEDLNYIN